MQPSNPWALLLLAISAEVIGTSCLRLSEGMTRPLPTLLVFSAYALAMALLSKVVLSIPLGITYALWSGIGTVVIVLVGRFAYSRPPRFSAGHQFAADAAGGCHQFRTGAVPDQSAAPEPGGTA